MADPADPRVAHLREHRLGDLGAGLAGDDQHLELAPGLDGHGTHPGAAPCGRCAAPGSWEAASTWRGPRSSSATERTPARARAASTVPSETPYVSTSRTRPELTSPLSSAGVPSATISPERITAIRSQS